MMYYMKEKWESLIPLLSHNDLTVAITTMKILDIVGMSKPLSGNCALKIASSIMIVFFRSLDLIGKVNLSF